VAGIAGAEPFTGALPTVSREANSSSVSVVGSDAMFPDHRPLQQYRVFNFAQIDEQGRLSWRPRSDGSDNHFGIFTRGAIIGAQIMTRLLGFDPGQH
jgi:hypothetical protein